MKYRLTVYPAVEETLTAKQFKFHTKEEMMAASDSIADMLLFLQDEICVMEDYTNSFMHEELHLGEWEEIDDEF